ncbi:MAG TPA: hypothetical protein VGP93_03790, partial [Polyangiaceae bacterium]|nr:hypothetical protein [Polyangiaceae bacterium]
MGSDQPEPSADPAPEDESAAPSEEPPPDALEAALPERRSSEPPLTPPGNKPRPRKYWRAVAALAPVFVLMTSDMHFALSVPLGLIGCALGAWAILDALGTFDDPLAQTPPLAETKLPWPRLI